MATEITTAKTQTMDYMTMLITQLKNQNPMEPMDNNQMASQLAQLSQLQLTEDMNGNLGTLNKTMTGMNTSFANSLWVAQADYAKSMLGKTVNFIDSASQTELQGTVKKLTFDSSGNPLLTINSGSQAYTASLSNLTGIQE
jgi:flagellar basal-body rod modification protein FlgD